MTLVECYVNNISAGWASVAASSQRFFLNSSTCLDATPGYFGAGVGHAGTAGFRNDARILTRYYGLQRLLNLGFG